MGHRSEYAFGCRHDCVPIEAAASAKLARRRSSQPNATGNGPGGEPKISCVPNVCPRMVLLLVFAQLTSVSNWPKLNWPWLAVVMSDFVVYRDIKHGVTDAQ